MEKQSNLYEDEITRFFALLNDRVWVREIQHVSSKRLVVTTMDGDVWNISSALNYARLLYLYERDQA